MKPIPVRPPGTVDTPYGPLTPADRDFIIRVKQAGLWEIPSGQLAQDHSDNPRVKEVGRTIASNHTLLNKQTDALAAQLGVKLPPLATLEQRQWVAEESSKHGEAFDNAFANLLRAAHGKVFGIIAAIRAGTRNDAVRAFAETANAVVMSHMQLLESTGHVHYAELPDPGVQPGPAPDRLASSFGNNNRGSILVWTVLIIAIVACASAVIRAVRPR